ncbi:MAG TPA: glycosyltransferase family 2 protein [Anaerolineaceae bacterium]|nr:glycosyltransferase family 2 protein [Anaerolineaceae bacterium]
MNEVPWIRRGSQVLVIVPGFNEEGNISRVIEQIRAQDLGEVLVIDDGSKDRTASAAQEAGAMVLRLPFNLGIGGAVQAGLKFAADAGYAYVLRLDGDGQHRADEAGKLLQLVMAGEADVAVGSRFLPAQHTYRPPMVRRIGIIWFSALVSLITRHKIYDATSGMQAYNRRAVVMLADDYPQDFPEVESRILMHKLNLRTVEITARMEPRTVGHSSITWIKSIYYIFKVSLGTFLGALRKTPRYFREEN